MQTVADEGRPASECQDRLVVLWLVGLTIVITVIFLQFYHHIFTPYEPAIMSWCIQTFSPLLAGMLAKWTGKTQTKAIVRNSHYYSAVFVSILYLAGAVIILYLIGPQRGNNAEKITMIETLSAVLGILMIPLSILIGACFGVKLTGTGKGTAGLLKSQKTIQKEP